MAGDLDQLADLLRGMTPGLKPAEISKISQKAAQALRKSNASRIAANVSPDGQAFEPRKFPLRSKTGRIRRKAKMFQKLRLNRHLKAKVTTDGFEVGFPGNATSRIALVHHEGREDYSSRRRKRRIKYPVRPLLGFSRDDEEAIMDAIETLFD